ncbi:MAG: RNA polymerase sigma factor RpoD/SigA [Gammaproteobacteria bacterium]
MDTRTTQTTNHPVLSALEERQLAQDIEAARQAVTAAVGTYLPAIHTLLQRYEECRTGAAQLEDYVLGIVSDEPQIDTSRTRTPAQLTAAMDLLLLAADPDGNCKNIKMRQRIWTSLRLHPDFISVLVEDFIAAVAQRTKLESRLTRLCRKTGCQPPASLQTLRRLAGSGNKVGQLAKRLLQTINVSGLSSRQLQNVQRQMVLALTRLHREKARLIIHNQRLVTAIARPFARSGIPLQDLIQEGNLGLLRAVDRFDFRRGYKFSTYAVWWIRRAVIRAVSAQTGPVHIPFHQDLARYKIERTRTLLAQQLGRNPDLVELASKSGVNPSRIRQLLHIRRIAVPLQGGTHGAGVDPLDVLANPLPTDPGETLDRLGICDEVEQTLSNLPAMQALVVRMRFGIGLHQEYTLADIGRQFGLSRERIRQIEAEALLSLRELAQGFQLRTFLGKEGD